MSVLIALLVLSFLVFFHELGHFIVARICGVGVEVFSIGFGKKLVGVKIGGTEYRISLIPLGGYVKLLEQTDSISGHSALSDKGAINTRGVDEPLVLSPCSPCQSPDFSSQSEASLENKPSAVSLENLECQGKSPPQESESVSESPPCRSEALAEESHTSKDISAFTKPQYDKGLESNPHTSIESPADSRIISAQAKCAPYTSKPPLTRIAILLAGPAFNFLLAFFLYLAVGAGGVMSLLPVVGEVKPHSPAALAGLQKGDVIESINGAPLRTWAELDGAIVDSKGALELSIRRGGQSVNLNLTPEIRQARNVFNERITRKMIGVASAGVVGEVAYMGLDLVRYAYDETLSAATLIAQGFVKLVSGVVPSSELGGVVSIVSVIGGASEDSLTRLLWLTALISVNLGVLNLLPIPALDGGHIVFNLYELIVRKAPSERVMHYLTLCGWAILLSLMFLGLYNDIFRLLG